MRLLIGIVFLGLALSSVAQPQQTIGGAISESGSLEAWQAQQQQIAEQQKQYYAQENEKRRKQAEDAVKNFIPENPWREINGVTNYAKGDGWKEFYGKVLEVQPTGIRVRGRIYIPSLNLHGVSIADVSDGEEFFIANFPYRVADETILEPSSKYVAKESGLFTYPTVTGGSHTIKKLDYGQPCEEPLWAIIEEQKQKALEEQQKVDAQKAAQAKKYAAQAKTITWLQSQATNGSSSAQCSLGLHYLSGEGCETNFEQGIYWLQKAAAQGDFEASKKLEQLNQQK